jgi:ligand-binding sensor domain-containing protein
MPFVIVLSVVGSGECKTLAARLPVDPQYIRTDFTVDDGLPDNTVNAVTQTDNGLLWVGTESGLASFDGRTFTRFTCEFLEQRRREPSTPCW